MSFLVSRSSRGVRILCALYILLFATFLHAGVIRGTVTDTSGATVTGATIVLMNGASYVNKTVSTADGSYQFVTGQSGRFSLIITAQSFRQLEVPAFYAAAGDSVERNLVLEPEWVHQSIVVSATGTPLPQQQTSFDTDLFSTLDLARREDFVSVLRMEPGAVVVQAGQRGAQTSLFLRGGDSNAARILFDGATVDEIGGIFDLGSLSTTGVQSAEVYRGPNSSLYGSDAASGVVNFTTTVAIRGFRARTHFPWIDITWERPQATSDGSKAPISRYVARCDMVSRRWEFQTHGTFTASRTTASKVTRTFT